MRRILIFTLLAVSTIGALGAAGVALSRTWIKPVSTPLATHNLAAPLPAESDSEFAAAMPMIDELRHRRGSLLDGTLLENAPAEPAPADNSYLDLLRREARRIDQLAADLEDQSRFDEADERRYEANQLRLQAREIHNNQGGTFNSRYSR